MRQVGPMAAATESMLLYEMLFVRQQLRLLLVNKGCQVELMYKPQFHGRKGLMKSDESSLANHVGCDVLSHVVLDTKFSAKS